MSLIAIDAMLLHCWPTSDNTLLLFLQRHNTSIVVEKTAVNRQASSAYSAYVDTKMSAAKK